MKKIVCLLLMVMLALPVRPAAAWSECGHMIITLLAFDLLKAEEQAKFLAVLDKHPRLKEEFTPPEGLPAEEVPRWRIGRAGYWPDVVRRSKLDRPMWHYEIGHALILGDATKLKVPERPGKLPEDATLETKSLYISQALPMCTRILGDKTASNEDRAVALCWVAHLVGDSHQPCHAGSLFMEGVFLQEDGDRGANRILTKQGTSMIPQQNNMHAFWDQLLGNEFVLEKIQSQMKEINGDAELIVKAKCALTVKNALDPQTWLAESRALSAENVYAPEVIESLKLVQRGLIPEPEAIDLSEEFQKNAQRIARIRVTEAAYRLAETWREAFK